MKELSAIIVLVVGIVFIPLIYHGVADAVSGSDLVFSKDSKPYGIPFSEWVGKWWQWHVSIQSKTNPQDPTNLTLVHPRNAYSPEKCEWNQNDENVWFLPDGRNLDIAQAENPEIRKCTVPQDKALLVQVYGGGCSYGEGLKTDKELKDCVDIGLEPVKFSAKVDGVEVMNSANRSDFLPSPYLYNLTYAQDNLYDVPAGTYRAMAGGYFLFVKPLSVGEHKVEFKEIWYKPGEASSESRISNVAYDLTVK